MTVSAGPFSAWSLAAILGWFVAVVVVWLLLIAYGRRGRSRM